MKKHKLLLFLTVCVLGMSVALSACSSPDDNTDPTDGDKPGESTYVEDKTTYYAIGSGAGDLAASSWNMNYTDLSFVKDTTVTDANVYTLTMKMYAGDRFQIIHDASWNDQMGASQLSGATAYGSLAYVTFDENGQMELFGGGDWGRDIEAAQGGVYTFTLTTYPDSFEMNTITYTRVVNYDMTVRGDISGVSMKDNGGNWESVIIVGDSDLKRDATGAVVQSDAEYSAVQVYNAAKSQTYHLAEGEYPVYNDETLGNVNLLPEGAYYITYSESKDEITITPTEHDIEIRGIADPVNMKIGTDEWTATVTVDASDYAEGNEYAAISLYDRITDSTLGQLNLSEGTYAVKYSGGNVAYEKLEYYIVGTIANAWNISADSPKLEATGRDGVYKTAFMVTDVSKANAWLKDNTDENGNPAIFAFRVVYGSQLNGIAEWCDAGNTFAYEAGEAAVTFVRGDGIYLTVDTSKVPEPVEYSYYLVGTIPSGWSVSDNSPKLEETEEGSGIYQIKYMVTDKSATESWLIEEGGTDDQGRTAKFAIKIASDPAGEGTSDNTFIYEVGEATITYDSNTGEVTVSVDPSKADEFKNDTDTYCLAGSGAVFNGSDWNTNGAADVTFTKDETVTDANVYTLKVTLNAGDKFKIVHKGSWDSAMDLSVITDPEGYFTEDDGNINAVVAGDYTFTLTTYPNNPSKNTVTFVWAEATVQPEPSFVADTNTYCLAGSGTVFNGSEWNTNGAADVTFTKDETVTDANVYTLTVTLEANDTFKIVVKGSWDGAMGLSVITDSEGAFGEDGGNIKVVTAGTYTFTLTTYPNNPSNNTVTFVLAENSD